MYYSENDFRLYHHQVKGARWGIMNGPPYPLDKAISTGKRLKAAAVNKVQETSGKIKEHHAKQAEIRAAKEVEREIKRLSGADFDGDSWDMLSKKVSDPAKKELKERVEKARKQAKQEAEAKKKQAEQEEKERQEKEKAQHEAEKQEAIKSGDAAKVDKFKSEMTLQELNEAVQRVNLNRQITNSMPKEQSKFDKAISALDKTKTVVNKGVDYWNSFAKIYNSFNEDPLPVIDGNLSNRIAEKNKKEREEEIYRSIKNSSSLKDKSSLDIVLSNMSNDEVAAMNKRLNNEKNIRNFSWEPNNTNNTNNNDNKGKKGKK